jgi:hypothetical protein
MDRQRWQTHFHSFSVLKNFPWLRQRSKEIREDDKGRANHIRPAFLHSGILDLGDEVENYSANKDRIE